MWLWVNLEVLTQEQKHHKGCITREFTNFVHVHSLTQKRSRSSTPVLSDFNLSHRDISFSQRHIQEICAIGLFISKKIIIIFLYFFFGGGGEDSGSVGGQLRGDKECSFSCVTRFDRVCSKVPESDARPVA